MNIALASTAGGFLYSMLLSSAALLSNEDVDFYSMEMLASAAVGMAPIVKLLLNALIFEFKLYRRNN